MVVWLSVPVGLPTVGVGVSLALLPRLGPFSSCWVALPSLDTRVCLSYCNLLNHVRVISLGGLSLFLKENRGLDLRESGGGLSRWEEWKEGKLQSACNV